MKTTLKGSFNGIATVRPGDIHSGAGDLFLEVFRRINAALIF